jgi:hypothetical protein
MDQISSPSSMISAPAHPNLIVVCSALMMMMLLRRRGIYGFSSQQQHCIMALASVKKA